MTTPLAPEKLSEQKAIFENTLVKEIMAEIRFNWNIMAERSEDRKGYSEKLISYIAQATTALLSVGSAAASVPCPEAGAVLAIGAVAVDLGAKATNAVIQHEKDKKTEKLGNYVFTDVNNLLEVCLKQFAEAASFRYEYLLAVKLSDKPDESVIPLASISARRVIEFLKRHIDANTDIKDINILLDGLIQGHSGNYVDQFKNNPLSGRAGDKKDYTVEGALGRSAMRIIDDSDNNIYHRKTPLHKQQKQDQHFSWGKTTYNEKNLLGKPIPESGPKYGYMLVDKFTQQNYGYDEKERPDCEKGAKFDTAIVQEEQAYQSRVYQATKQDIIAYLANKKPKQSFIEYIRVKTNQEISDVWAKNIQFDETNSFKECDFSNVNFSGCLFNKVTFIDADLSGTNLNFVKVTDSSFNNVKLNKTDLSFSQLENVTFQEVSDIDAKWIGAKIAIENIKDNRIEKLKQEQEEAAESARQNFDMVYKELKRIEDEVEEKIEKLDNKIGKNSEIILELIEKTKELTNISAYKEYCQNLITEKANQTDVKILTEEVNRMNEKLKEVEKQKTKASNKVKSLVMNGVITGKKAKLTVRGVETNLISEAEEETEELTEERKKELEILEKKDNHVTAKILQGGFYGEESEVNIEDVKTQVFGNNRKYKPVEKLSIDDATKTEFEKFINNSKDLFSEAQKDIMFEILSEKENFTHNELMKILTNKELKLNSDQKTILRNLLLEMKVKNKVADKPSQVELLQGIGTFNHSLNGKNPAVESIQQENKIQKQL